MRVIKGISWIAALRILIRGSIFIKIAILARLLSPAAFGSFGIVSLVLGLLEMLTETGINVFLIQEKNHHQYLNSAWVISIIRGSIIASLMVLAAPIMSSFFNNPDSFNLYLLASIIPLLRGFINPNNILLQKNLTFDKEFYYRLTISLTETVGSILIAVITKSPTALVLGMCVSALVEVLLSFSIRPWPAFKLNLSHVKIVLSHGKWVNIFGIFDYLYTQSDNAVVGKLLGAQSLGVYQNAYKLSTLPITEVSDTFYKVSFPLFSKLGVVEKKPRRQMMLVVTTVIACSLILGFSINLFAGPIVSIVLGPGWESAVGVIKILSIGGIARGIILSFNPVFMANKKQNYVAAITIISFLGLIGTIFPLTQNFGLEGTATASLLGSLFALPVAVFLFTRVSRPSLQNN